jgi:hypothetical protein
LPFDRQRAGDDRAQVNGVEVGPYGSRRLRAFQERSEPVLQRSGGLPDGVCDLGGVGDGGGERGVLSRVLRDPAKEGEERCAGSSASTSAPTASARSCSRSASTATSSSSLVGRCR